MESYTVEGRNAELYCLIGPVTRPYAVAFLVARGGTLLDRAGRPVAPRRHDFVATPWRELSRWRRIGLWFAFQRALWKHREW